MAFNDSGTYVLPAGNPVLTGTTITSTWANNTLNDIATALTTCVTRDGQSPPTANLPMGSFKITGLAAATANGDAVRYEQVPFLAGTPLPVASGGTGAATLAGANIPVTNAANTFTATQTFNGTSSTLGTVLLDSAETVNIVAAAPSSTTNLYVQSGSVQYYTSNAANNFIVNIAFSSGTSMNTAMATGQSVTAALITTQNTTAYYGTAVQVDGTGTGVTTRWIGGAPIAGNASGLDTYRFAVIKTGSATYTVLASLTQFKA